MSTVLMTPQFSELRFELRGLLDQIAGYCEILVHQPFASGTESLAEGAQDVHALATSIGASLHANRLSARQLEAVGRRLLTLSGRISQRSTELLRSAANDGQTQLAPDLTRLRAAADRLLPLAHELIINPEALATTMAPPAVEVAAAAPAAPRADRNAADLLGSALLIVDDNEGNRDLLARRLARAGYTSITTARHGREALDLMQQRDFDLVLLDVMMPELDGIGVLRVVKADARLRDVPIVMVSAVDDVASVAQCIELGAEDYLPKPFEQTILQARIRGSLERKRLRDADKRRTAELERALLEVKKAREESEHLLHNILPAPVAEELREKNAVDPMYFEDATIVFTDFVGFTLSTAALSAEELVCLLHDYFTGIDHITERYGLEKLKTIGDAYMYVGGLPSRNPAHPVDAILAAFEILEFVAEMDRSGRGAGWRIRIGVHTGPVIAGVVGVRKFSFDVWGESVNTASRMESSGVPDRINISERTYSRVKDFFLCDARGKVATKDGCSLDMYLAAGAQPKLLAAGNFARRYRTYFGRELREFPASLKRAD